MTNTFIIHEIQDFENIGEVINNQEFNQVSKND